VIPSARRLPDSWTAFRVPFDRAWINAVKLSVPPPSRRWVPSQKEWEIAPGYARHIVALTIKTFSYCIDADRVGGTGDRPGGSSPVQSRRDGDHYATLHLTPSAPAAVVAAAYKALSRLHHPDRGGDHEAMLALNDAYQKLCERGAAA